MWQPEATHAGADGDGGAPRFTPPLPINVPAEIGGYRIQRVIGAGGMATVYAAMQKQPRRVVALKVMKAGLTHGPHGQAEVAMRRFTREIEILGKLRHPFIAQIYAAGMHDEGAGATPYFVMEYVQGAKSITEYIAARQLDLRERLKLFAKVCSAVEHGHRRKIIHRDLKPANILIDEAGDPKIIDFGVAQATELDLSSQTMHTEAGRLVGTLQYMSPEQLSGRPQDLDARCDVYALGVLLYRITTGKPPRDLEGLPVYEAVRVIREQSPRRPSEINDSIRGDLETIILKAMEPDRARRYRNAGSLGRDIVRYLANKPIHARRASALYRAGLFIRRHRVAITSGGIVALIMSVALAIVLLQRGEPSTTHLTSNTTSPNATAPAQSPSQTPAPATPQQPPPQSSPPSAASPATGLPQTPPSSLVALAPNRPHTLGGHTGSITALAFAQDGRRLASAAHDRTVRLWDLSLDPPSHAVVHFDDAPIIHISFSGDGEILASAGERGQVWLIDVPGAMEARQMQADSVYALPRTFGATIRSLAFDADGGRVAVGLDDLTLGVYPIAPAGQAPARDLVMRSSTGAITALAFGGNRRWIAGGSQSGTVYLWNADDGSVIERFTDIRGRIATMGFASVWRRVDEHTLEVIPRLVAVGGNGAAVTWPVEANDEVAPVVFPACGGETMSATLDPTGRWLACGTMTQASIWNMQRPLEPRQVSALPSDQTIYAIAIDPDGQWCAMGYANGDIRLIPTGAPR